MNSFQKINDIKENFDDRLYQTDDFKNTKGLLYNFGEYIEKHKGVLYGLLGATIFNIAANAIPQNSTQTLSEPVVMEQMIVADTSNQKTVNADGMDMYAKIQSFKDNVSLGNTIQNHRYIGQEIHQLNSKSIDDLKNDAVGTVKVFANPFWKGNFVEVTVSAENSNQFMFPNEINFKANHDNALLLVDNSQQTLYYNHHQAAEFADYAETKNTTLMTKYIMYHESAHASYRQSNQLGADADILKGEVHSDISSLTMIGVESKNLQEFNEAADMLINLRVKSLGQGDYGHNDAYAVTELKRVINENPDLLKMKSEDVSEFSYMLTDTLFKENVKHNNQYLLDKMGITLDQKSIFNDLKAGRNLDLYDAVGMKLTNKYSFRSESITADGMDSRIEKFAEKIEKEMKNNMKFDAVSTLLYRDNGGSVANTTKAIKDSVDKHPIISKTVIDPVLQKVHIDGLDYDLSKINDIRLETIAKQSQNYISKHNMKI